MRFLDGPRYMVEEVEEYGGFVVLHIRGNRDAILRGEGQGGQVDFAAFSVIHDHAEMLVVLNTVIHDVAALFFAEGDQLSCKGFRRLPCCRS